MRWRFLPLYLGLVFITFVLSWRLIDLTVVQGAYYRNLADGNQIAEVNIRAPRGIIYDRNGKVLARNIPVFKLQISNFKFQTIFKDEALKMEAEKGSKVSKLHLDLGREYPEASATAHVLGYVNEVTQKEITTVYKLGDYIGRTGIEEQYESLLRGIDGKELIQRDATGKKLQALGRLEPVPGKNLALSLDLDLQKIAAKEMEGKTGAVVVSNPQTGEILALYSNPSYDPNSLDRTGDFFNRVVSGLYPPGSTFKIITGTAALETGKINGNTQIEDTGVITSGAFSFGNWYFLEYGKTDGLVDIVKAISRSNDIFFYKAAEMVGIENLESWGKKFGLSKPLGIDLPAESAGQVRSERDWYLGDTYHTGIGQGDLEVTPLQVNFWTNVIANGGKLCRPRLTNLSNLINCKSIGIKPETISLITEGMRKACSEGGTGWPFFGFKIPVACKTGTAEYGDSQNKTHAWFTIFAPVEKSTITATVLVEGGGEGSNVAAPIAKKILEEYFKAAR